MSKNNLVAHFKCACYCYSKCTKDLSDFFEFKRQKTCFIGIHIDFPGIPCKRNKVNFNLQKVRIKDTCITLELKKKSYRESAAVRFYRKPEPVTDFSL